MGEFKTQELANTVWAYATAAHGAQALFAAIGEVAVPQMGAYNAQGLSNTVWAYATAQHADATLFDAVAG